MPIKPTIQSLSLAIAFDEGLDVDRTGEPPAMRILATLSNHYGEWGDEAEFLHKAQLICQVLEREDDPFPVRAFVRQDTDDVVDASDPDEWQEVLVQAAIDQTVGFLESEVEAGSQIEAKAKPDDALGLGTNSNSMQMAIAQVLDCSKALYADEAMDSRISICP